MLVCGVTLLVAAAVILRAIPWLTNYPLHRDEALYGYWARLIASGRDPLLLTPWIDKPPLALYLSAASIRAFGVSELVLRLPGIIASLLTVLVTYGLARRAYGMRVALLAAGLIILSPFAILFAPTAFTDPWLTLWLVAAAWAALARRPFLAGLLLGLAVASKQQGVLAVPLVAVLLLLSHSCRRAGMHPGSDCHCEGPQPRSNPSHAREIVIGKSRGPRAPRLRILAPLLLRSILGFALVFAAVTYWDSLRWVNRPSFWDRSLATYGQLGLAPLAEWPQRAGDWATQLGYLFGLPALSALMLLVAASAGVRAILPQRGAQRMRTSARSLAPLLAGFPSRVGGMRPRNDHHCELPIPRGGMRPARNSWARDASALDSEKSSDCHPERVDLASCREVNACPCLSMTIRPLEERAKDLRSPGVSGQGPHLRRNNLCYAGKIATGYPPAPVGPGDSRPRNDNAMGKRVDVVLTLYTAGYLALHFVITFQPWDRYLLPLLPLVCVLAARGLVLAWERLDARSRLQRPLRLAVPLLLAPLLLYASWLGAAGRLPVGSDHGAYAGLDQAVSILRDQPGDAVIYHRWLSWHYDFYLLDAPQERRWWGSGWKLAADAARTARAEPDRRQWVVLPDWESSAAEELQLPLASKGLALLEIKRIYRPDTSRAFTMYRIAPFRAEVTP